MTDKHARQIQARRRSPPDLPPTQPTDSAVRIAQGKARPIPNFDKYIQLARKHGIRQARYLAVQLDLARYWWETDKVTPLPPSGSDTRRLLGQTSRCAALLSEALSALDPSTRNRIVELDMRLDLRSLLQDIYRLGRAAKDAEQTVPRSRAGSRGRREIFELACDLRRIYVRALGKDAPRLTRDGKYGGKFFRFARDVMTLFGTPRLSGDALGFQLRRAIKAIDAEARAKSML